MGGHLVTDRCIDIMCWPHYTSVSFDPMLLYRSVGCNRRTVLATARENETYFHTSKLFRSVSFMLCNGLLVLVCMADLVTLYTTPP